MNTETPNRLANEKSPYLLQHANNPVNWYPWGEEAFEKAKQEDKPIFLSIGYSTCHWCHVFERESFEDDEVAAVLNKFFVSIKVDREERPDIDNIYMDVCQAMTGQGGWPLTIIMTPDKKPFFAGTYFPKESRHGMPGLMDILKSIIEKWQQDSTALTEAADQVVDSMKNQNQHPQPGEINEELFHQTYLLFKSSFDEHYGGFGPAPKFPTPHNLMFLLRYYKKYKKSEALAMVEKTLQSMYRGGIYDHVGHGFSRYSTDKKWLVPHFEKMLYDNALLAIVYTKAYQVTENTLYKEVAQNIFEYILRDMASSNGGFYSAEDADSEGVEGKFYVWSPQEVIEVLGTEKGSEFCSYYDITKNGNFEGKSIPNLINFDENFKVLKKLKESRLKLFAAREKRVHPFKDDKILTAWNGMMIAALAIGGQILQNKKYIETAEDAVKFIDDNLINSKGRLLARYRDKEAAYPAYIDDYAFLIWGLLELYHASSNDHYLKKALQLNEDTLKLFWDEQNGGFFFYGSDSEQLIIRSKEIYDGAIPSGNSVTALNLIRLAKLTGEKKLQEYANKQLKTFAGEATRIPRGHSFLILSGLYL